MRWPAQLSRRTKNVHKNDFGHVLVIAGSSRMLGANALCSLAAMRTGAGLVTAAVPKSLNRPLQSKLSAVVMTRPLPETAAGTFSLKAWTDLAGSWSKYQSCVIGPGISTHSQTQKFVLKVIQECPVPLVIDADALRALVDHLDVLKDRTAETVLTPHPGEMALIARQLSADSLQGEGARKREVLKFVCQHPCVLVLKGHRTVVAQKAKKIYINTTGNAGMATAGSGDVLAGIIAALLAQGLEGFEAAKIGVYAHGLAGDSAAQQKTKVSMIAADLIEHIPEAIKCMQK